MKLVLASQNRKKIAELQAILMRLIPDVEIASLADVGIMEEIIEDGKTFEENALIKARAAAKSGYMGVGDDSGLCVEALGGAPGIYSARYAGEHGNDDANTDRLLRELEGKENRRACFRCVIACVFPDGSAPIVCSGQLDGEITLNRQGEGGFGYDPVFYYPAAQMTLAQMGAEDKNQISHRGQALTRFAAALRERLKTEV